MVPAEKKLAWLRENYHKYANDLHGEAHIDLWLHVAQEMKEAGLYGASVAPQLIVNRLRPWWAQVRREMKEKGVAPSAPAPVKKKPPTPPTTNCRRYDVSDLT